jgi:hypothetical protein
LRRFTVAVPEPHRHGRSRAQAARPLRHDHLLHARDIIDLARQQDAGAIAQRDQAAVELSVGGAGQGEAVILGDENASLQG